MSVSRKDDKCIEEEFSGVADIERGASPTSGRTAEVEISAESERAQRRRKLHRVPPQVREKNKHIYDPVAVSVGPYHHGKPELRRYEEFKDEVLNIMLNSDGGAKDKGLLFRGEILERIDEIRSFYGGLSTDEYDDKALVEMMVRDACIVLCYMEILMLDQERTDQVIQFIGLLQIYLMSGDYFMLENQIPWWVIKLLIRLTYDDKDEGEALICRFLSYINFADDSILNRVPWKEGKETEPLHLLEALCKTRVKVEINFIIDLVKEHSLCPRWWRRRKRSQSRFYELIKRPFRSATELNSKGIYFRPSSNYVNDIRFSSYSFYGVLHLPILAVDKDSIAFFSNIIALEMSPGITNTGSAMTSYVNFMKSLIESPKDVKMLQENGILFSYLEDNEQIVTMFKELDTYGGDNFYIFNDIKKRINEHCNSKAKTWIAELINTYFRNPWTAIALFAAAILLCLTLLQTYYTLNPRKSGN